MFQATLFLSIFAQKRPMEREGLLFVFTTERLLCLLFAVIVLVVLLRLLIKSDGSFSGLNFPFLKSAVTFFTMMNALFFCLADYSRPAFMTAMLLMTLVLLVLRPDYDRRSLPVSLLCLLGIVLSTLEHLYARPDVLVGFAFAFIVLASGIEYGVVVWHLRNRLSDVRLAQISVVVETQIFKLAAVSLYALSLLGWYLGWSVTGLVLLVVYVLYVTFLVWLCCLRPGVFFQPVPFALLRKELFKNFGTEILLGMARDNSGQSIYQRLCSYFEEEKPYLDPDLTVGEVARAIYTNKVYLGQAIKHYSQLNFPRFVNRYRVLHAQKLFRENRNLKITQLCLMSGFKTKATFLAAFHMETGENPKEWCDYIRSKSR